MKSKLQGKYPIIVQLTPQILHRVICKKKFLNCILTFLFVALYDSSLTTILFPILVNKVRKLYFQENVKRQSIIQFVLITSLFYKFPLKIIGMYLDTKSTFQEHLNNVLRKVNKTIGLLHNQAFLPRQVTMPTFLPSFSYGR